MTLRYFASIFLAAIVFTSTAFSAERRKAIDPPGFQRISVGGHDVSCMPVDAPWVRAALESYKAPPRPSTMPAELITQIQNQRDELTKRMIADLALPSEKYVASVFDVTLLPGLQRLSEFRPPFIYLVATRAKLKEVTQAGWLDPRYYYNRVADEIIYDDNVKLSIDQAMDDSLLWITIDPDENEESKTKKLLTSISSDAASLTQSIWGRGNGLVQGAIGKLIYDQAVAPLRLPPEQRWFGTGLSGVLSAEYSAKILGLDPEEIIARMTAESPQVLLKAASVDLLHPISAAELQAEYRTVYEDAFRRKANAVINRWLDNAEPGAVPKVLAAMRKKLPADGPGLLKLIKEQTNVDLTADVAPQTQP